MRRALRSFAHFWYDFVIGDDWRMAAAAVLILALTALAAHHGFNLWWFAPLAVVATVAGSVLMAIRSSGERRRDR
jgi:L-asparagine transporter-like permease